MKIVFVLKRWLVLAPLVLVGLFARGGEWTVVQTGQGTWVAYPADSTELASFAPLRTTSAAQRLTAATTYQISFSFNGIHDFSVPVAAGGSVAVSLSLPVGSQFGSCTIDGALSEYPKDGVFAFSNVTASHAVNIDFISPVYVDAVSGDDGRLGVVPTKAKRTLGAAVKAAQGLPVYVKPGVYGPVTAVTAGMNLIALSTNVAETVIDGGGTNRVVTFPAGTSGSLSGFTIRNGQTTESGGGVFAAEGARVTVRRCIVTNCRAAGAGTAVCGVVQGSDGSLTLRSSLIVKNGNDGAGAAVSQAKLIGCTVASNKGATPTVAASECVVCAISGGLDGKDISCALEPFFAASEPEPYRLILRYEKSVMVDFASYVEQDELDLAGEPRTVEDAAHPGAKVSCCGCYTRPVVIHTGVTINGTDCGDISGEGWEMGRDHRILLKGPNKLVVSGRGVDGFADSRLCVVSNAVVVLSNFTSNVSGLNLSTALQVNDGVTADIYLAGNNELRSGTQTSGLYVKNRAVVRIRAAEGYARSAAVLKAYGGRYAAGIGTPNWDGGCGTTEIYSGTVCGYGGDCAPGIGSPYVSSGVLLTTIRIYGGSVEGWGNQSPGIGLCGGDVCDIRILGGTVRAGMRVVTKEDPPDIGNLYDDLRSESMLVIQGGTVYAERGPNRVSESRRGGADGRSPVYCVSVPCATGPAQVSGLPSWYGTNDLVAISGRLYFYLPNGTYKFKVNGLTYSATVAGNHVTAKPADVVTVAMTSSACDVPVYWFGEYGLTETEMMGLYDIATNVSMNPVSPGSSARLANWQSYVAGLDPTNANDMFYAVISNTADGAMSVGPNVMRPDRIYGVDVSRTLPFDAWTNITVGADGSVVLPQDGSNAFYRVTVDLKEE